MAERAFVASYECVLCRAKCTAKSDSALAMLAICAGCQDKRFKAGKEAQRRAEGRQ